MLTRNIKTILKSKLAEVQERRLNTGRIYLDGLKGSLLSRGTSGWLDEMIIWKIPKFFKGIGKNHKGIDIFHGGEYQ